MPRLTAEKRKKLERLAARPDREIDLSDIPVWYVVWGLTTAIVVNAGESISRELNSRAWGQILGLFSLFKGLTILITPNGTRMGNSLGPTLGPLFLK